MDRGAFRRATTLLILCVMWFKVTISQTSVQVAPNTENACRLHQISATTWFYKCCNGYYKHNITTCLACPIGKYGDGCFSDCQCENDANCNNVDGSCKCHQGYYGNTCAFSCNCKHGAYCNMMDGSCACQPGYYGALCQHACNCPPNSMCSQAADDCVCEDGFYGDQCNERCDCPNNYVCDPRDGSCSCKPGYFGSECSRLCECYNGALCGDLDPYQCVCPTEWTGSSCTECVSHSNYCNDKCKHCYNGGTCSPAEGSCDCSPGWQGNYCDNVCNDGFYGYGCIAQCECGNEGSCHHVTGTCTCTPGWIGYKCTEKCPVNCQDCIEDGEITCTSCKSGWVGVTCEKPCEHGMFGTQCASKCPYCGGNYCYHVDGRCDCPHSSTGLALNGCGENICGCQNGGRCNTLGCECLDPWLGQFCNETSRISTPGSPISGPAIQLSSSQIAVIVPVVVFVFITVGVVVILLMVRRQYHSKCAKKTDNIRVHPVFSLDNSIPAYEAKCLDRDLMHSEKTCRHDLVRNSTARHTYPMSKYHVTNLLETDLTSCSVRCDYTTTSSVRNSELYDQAYSESSSSDPVVDISRKKTQSIGNSANEYNQLAINRITPQQQISSYLHNTPRPVNSFGNGSVDDPDTHIYAEPFYNQRTLEQTAGRIIRAEEYRISPATHAITCNDESQYDTLYDYTKRGNRKHNSNSENLTEPGTNGSNKLDVCKDSVSGNHIYNTVNDTY